jgi:hypothetical protein
MELTPVLWLAPMAIAPFALATALAPSAVAPLPLPILFAPSAVARVPLAFAFVPTAVAFAPLAWAFAPQPKDDADAEAPLLLPVTVLTTGVVVGVAFVRTCAVVTLTSLTTALGVEVVLTPVIALANVGAVVPLVKKLFAVGAVTLVTNVPVVEVTLVTTCCDVDVPVTTGTFSSVMVGEGVLVLTNSTPPLPVVVLPPLAKANFVVLLGATLGLNAGTMTLVGTPVVGVMPVTVPVAEATLATPGPVGAVTPVTAVPVVIPALVKNEFCVVCTPVTALANVGVTPVTTVVPAWPVMPLTALAKVGLTPVTHVSAEAEANSAALRLTRLTVSRRRRRPVMSISPATNPCHLPR